MADGPAELLAGWLEGAPVAATSWMSVRLTRVVGWGLSVRRGL